MYIWDMNTVITFPTDSSHKASYIIQTDKQNQTIKQNKRGT